MPKHSPWGSVALLTTAAVAGQVAQLSCGLPLLALQVTLQTEHAWLIGLATGLPWLAVSLGLAQVNRLAARWGARRTAWTGLGISLLGLLLLLSTAIPLLMLGGMAIGYGLALRWVTLETWLYALTPSNWRGRVVGFTEFLLGVGFAAGPWLVSQLTPPALVGCAAALVALAVASSALVPRDTAPRLQARSLSAFWLDARLTLRVLPLSVLCIFVAGFIDMAFVGLLPHYARSLGDSPAQGLAYVSVFGAGLVMGPLPFGWLADKKGVSSAALLAMVLGCLGALALGLASGVSPWALGLIGVATGGLFALAFVDVALMHSHARMGIFMSTVGALYGVFGALGPWLAGGLMDVLGIRSLPALVALTLLFGLALAWRAQRRSHGPRRHRA